jgi:hypothetical protein
MRRASFFVLTLITFALFLADVAAAEPAPEDSPQVVCKTQPKKSGEEPRLGAYRFRPHTCRVHKLGLARPDSQLYLRVHWLHWGTLNATARGEVPGIELDFRTGKRSVFYSPVKLRLEKPLLMCGHLVFSELVVDFLEPEYITHEKIDLVPNPKAGCR